MEKGGKSESRILSSGDYGSAPRNTAHTFQILDPDTEMVGVIQPEGFEYVIQTRYTIDTNLLES